MAVEVNKLYEAALAVKRGERKLDTLPETVRPAVRRLLGKRENVIRDYATTRQATRVKYVTHSKIGRVHAS